MDDGDAMSRMNGAAARARDAGWPNKMQPGAPGAEAKYVLLIFLRNLY
jgi:hypothetical protein